MKEVTIKVPEEQYRFFIELLQQLGLETSDEETFEVPEVHKDIVRNRLKNLKVENLKDWDEVKEKFTFK
jgi:hypothetical protein